MGNAQTSTEDREQRLDEVVTAYLRALASGQVPDRQEWLARHPDLREDLADFLAAQEEMNRLAGPLREVVRAAATLSQGADVTPGRLQDLLLDSPSRFLGDYELLDVIGQGGMGVVYRARQKSLNRLVAVKRLRGGRPAEETQRFRNEALTVAELDHAHIVPVYEVGEHDGQLYFSMKLFEGGSLAEHLDRYIADARAAARLVAEVARAVHHAHQRGVLHRDLKPSNILLDARGQPHVTDFGLAKRVTDEDSLTLSGQLVGTPGYMAPEQTVSKKAPLTTAADVYGLGAILYALLTGRPPFRGETVLDTLQQVKEQEPQRLCKLNPRVARDLETICLKCLRKEPAQRYGSAEALAEDLERFLNGEPIQARPMGALARLRRWCSRNPLGAALGLTIGLAIVGLAVGTILLWQEKRQTSDALRQAERERDAKAQQQRQARRAVDDMYTAVAEQWLANQPHLQRLQKDFLEKALAYYQQAAAEDGSDPDVKAQAASSSIRVGAIQTALGRPEQARQALRRGIAQLEPLIADFPARADYVRKLAECHNQLGAAHLKTASLSDAEAAYKRAIELWRKQVFDTAEWSEQRRAAQATIQGNLAWVLTNSGKSRDAEEQYRMALATLAKAVAQHPHDRNLRMSFAWTHNNRGNLYQNVGRYPDAARSYQEAVTLFKKLAEDFPTVPDCRDGWASALSNLGGALEHNGQRGEAIARTREAAAILERLARDYPDVVDYSWELGSALGNLGTSLGNDGNGEEADKTLSRAGVVFQKLVKEYPRVPQYRNDLAINERHRGDLLRRQLKRPADAEVAYQRAIAIGQKLVTDFPDTAEFQSHLALSYGRFGVLHHASGRLQAAEAAFREALRIQERLAAAEPGNAFYQNTLRETRLNLAAVLVAEAPPFPEAAWVARVLEEELKKDPQHGDLWYRLGVARYRLGNADGAAQALVKSRELQFNYGRAGAFYGAMAVWKKGDRKLARGIYDAVMDVMARSPLAPTEQELKLRAEAESLLGITRDAEADAYPTPRNSSADKKKGGR